MMSADKRVKILSEAKPNLCVAFFGDESKLLACGATYSEAVEAPIHYPRKISRKL
jgi:hypothetical protein